MSVVGAVAKGSISSVGSITGDQAAEALTSYLGYSPVDSGSALADDGGLIPPSPITSEDVVTLDGGTAAGTASPTASANGTPIPSGAREHDGSVVESARISGAPPIFQNVEIGGGRITGLEVSPDRQSDSQRNIPSINASRTLVPEASVRLIVVDDMKSLDELIPRDDNDYGVLTGADGVEQIYKL